MNFTSLIYWLHWLDASLKFYSCIRNIEILMEGVQGAAMNSFSYLSEVELAAVITYTRQSWGNAEKGDGEIVIPKDIVDYKEPKI